MRLRALLTLLVLFMLGPLWSSEARLSQVFYDEITLDQLVAREGAIVLVRQQSPPSRVNTVPYTVTHTSGELLRSTYAVQLARVIVEEVLRGDGEPLKAGDALELYSPDALTMFSLTLRYEATGSTKSPIFQHVQGEELSVAHPADARFIVFVGAPSALAAEEGPTQDAWRGMAEALRGTRPFTVSGAALPASRRQEIEALFNPPAR